MNILRFNNFSEIFEKSIGSEEIRKKWYSDLDKKTFYKLVNIDPTSVRKKEFSKPGKYVKWLITQYKKVQKYGYYDTRLIQSQDYDLWLRIIKYEEIFVLPEKLTNYRVRDDGKNLSINMSENSIKRSIFESIYFLKIITEFDVKTLSLSIEENCDENNKYLKLFEYFIKKEKNIYATAMLLSMFDNLENDSQFLLGNYKSFYEVYSNYDLLTIIEVNKLREEINRKDLQIIELNNLVKSYRKLSYKELLKILIKKIFNFKDN